MDGLLERICIIKGAGVEAIGAQQLGAEYSPLQEKEDQTSSLGDCQRVGAGAMEHCCSDVCWCLESHSFQLLALLQCIFLNLLAAVAVVQCSRKF